MIHIFNNKRAEEYLPIGPAVSIRCMSSPYCIDFFRKLGHPLKEYGKLSGGYVRTLDCVFDDINPDTKDETEGFVLFDMNMARRIRNFVEEIKDSLPDVVISCDSGESRSFALAMGLREKYGWNYDDGLRLMIPKDPNIFVYRTFMKALDEVRPSQKIS